MNIDEQLEVWMAVPIKTKADRLELLAAVMHGLGWRMVHSPVGLLVLAEATHERLCSHPVLSQALNRPHMRRLKPMRLIRGARLLHHWAEVARREEASWATGLRDPIQNIEDALAAKAKQPPAAHSDFVDRLHLGRLYGKETS